VTVPALDVLGKAKGDIDDIVNYISTDNPVAAQQLRDDILAKIDLPPFHPRLYRKGKMPGTREMVVRHNYIVIYAETPELVTILRVIHAARLWP
jgi:addiction module RelE/StbE family toxin